MTMLRLFLVVAALAIELPAATFHLDLPFRTMRHPIQSAREHPVTTRRVIGAIAGAATIGDMVSTHEAACKPPLTLGSCFPSQYAHEANPIYAPHGVLIATRFDAIKLGEVLALTAGEEIPRMLHLPHLDVIEKIETDINIAAAAVNTGLTVSNGVVYLTTHAKK